MRATAGKFLQTKRVVREIAGKTTPHEVIGLGEGPAYLLVHKSGLDDGFTHQVFDKKDQPDFSGTFELKKQIRLRPSCLA